MFIATLIAIAAVLYSAWYFCWPRRKKSKSGKKDIPDTLEFRTAIHEAGHAVSAWWCSGIIKVFSITIKKNADAEGCVVLSLFNNTSKDILWCNLIITLSGMTAETYIYGRASSSSAKADLILARKLVNKLIALGEEKIPWKIKDLPSLPFEKMFELELSNVERKIFRQAYLFSKQLIHTRIQEHCKLVIAILKNRTMQEDQLIDLLGDRKFLHLVGCMGVHKFYGAT